MALLLLIDGLVSHAATAWETLCPNLARLAATGQHGTMATAGPDADAPLAQLFGLALPPDQGPPLGFYAAVAAGLQPDPNLTWGMLAFTHVRQHRDKLLLVSPERTGQTLDECAALSAALLEEWRPMGWTLHQRQGLPPLLSTPQELRLRIRPLDALDGASLAEHLPQGPDAFTLTQLLNSGQMALCNHPLNRQRQASGRLTLNTPWLWGLGRGHPLPDPSEGRGACWSSLLPVLGLALAGGYVPSPISAPAGLEELASLLPLLRGSGVVYLQSPRVLAQHGLHAEAHARLQAIDHELVAPLMARCAERGERLLVSGVTPWPSEATVPWIDSLPASPGVLERLRQRIQRHESSTLAWSEAHRRWWP